MAMPADCPTPLALQAAVAVRAAPGSSLLKDVALLQAGDTFGELCLLVSSWQGSAKCS